MQQHCVPKLKRPRRQGEVSLLMGMEVRTTRLTISTDRTWDGDDKWMILCFIGVFIMRIEKSKSIAKMDLC
jgi:hypothetical protein